MSTLTWKKRLAVLAGHQTDSFRLVMPSTV